jgi:O-antigen ligase
MKEFFVLSVGFGRGDWGYILRGKFGFWYDYLHTLFSSGYLSILFGKGHPVLDSRSSGYLPYLFNEPHSDFVRILYQYGLLGFSLFVAFFSIIIKSSIVFRKNSTTLNEKLLGDMGIIMGIALMLYAITIEPMRYPVFWWYYSAIASYILVQGSYLNESGVYNKSLHPLQV